MIICFFCSDDISWASQLIAVDDINSTQFAGWSESKVLPHENVGGNVS